MIYSKIIFVITAAALLVLIATIVPSASADECNGYSPSEDRIQIGADLR